MNLLFQAFLFTETTTHYMTKDRGASWIKFEVPLAPAFETAGYLMSFHSGYADYLLYQGGLILLKFAAVLI